MKHHGITLVWQLVVSLRQKLNENVRCIDFGNHYIP